METKLVRIAEISATSKIIKELNVKLIGHYRYYGVTWNFRKITTFLHKVQQFLFKAMNRKTYYCLY